MLRIESPPLVVDSPQKEKTSMPVEVLRKIFGALKFYSGSVFDANAIFGRKD
jgi:hypothetical protein